MKKVKTKAYAFCPLDTKLQFYPIKADISLIFILPS